MELYAKGGGKNKRGAAVIFGAGGVWGRIWGWIMILKLCPTAFPARGGTV